MRRMRRCGIDWVEVETGDGSFVVTTKESQMSFLVRLFFPFERDERRIEGSLARETHQKRRRVARRIA